MYKKNNIYKLWFSYLGKKNKSYDPIIIVLGNNFH